MLKLALSCDVVEVVLGTRFFVGGDTPNFGHAFFKSHSLPNMWPVLVEFRSASSAGVANETNRRITVKPKSADDYVGQPNKNKTKTNKHRKSECQKDAVMSALLGFRTT